MTREQTRLFQFFTSQEYSTLLTNLMEDFNSASSESRQTGGGGGASSKPKTE